MLFFGHGAGETFRDGRRYGALRARQPPVGQRQTGGLMTGTSAGSQLHWSSRLTFLMASIGFAVGLGNIWRFPYVAGEHGGGAFVLIYLLFALGIGVPMVIAEWAIGRSSPGTVSPAGSLRALALRSGAAGAWGGVGTLAVCAAFLLMLFYTTITGWTMDYFAQALQGAFHGIDAEGSQALFQGLMDSPARMFFWHTLAVALAVYVNSLGLRSGIERAVNLLMPALFVSILLMVGYAAAMGDLGAAARFLLAPHFDELSGETVLMALGQAFFSIGIAMAVTIAYGAYLQRSVSIARNAFILVGADTLVALLAGFAVFPLVFAHGMAPDSGEGLVFQTLPIIFGDFPGGGVFAAIFFFLLIAAALTSCISGFVPIIAWVKEKFGLRHAPAALLVGAAVWLLGLGTVLSFNLAENFHPLAFLGILGDMTIYELLDYLVSNLLLPLGALCTAIFIGWFASGEAVRAEIGLGDGAGYQAWRLLIRWVIPVAVAAIFINGLAA